MILVVDMNWKKESLGFYEFVLPIVRIAETLGECRVNHYLEVNYENTSLYDKIILSGTALKDTVTLSQSEKFVWLKETKSPVLGICAGMEMIAVVFGTHLARCLEIGMTKITPLKKNLFFSDSLKAYSLHSFCVKRSADFEVWAKSEACAQIIKHKTKHIYGMLFHPEVRNPELIKRFIQLNDEVSP